MGGYKAKSAVIAIVSLIIFLIASMALGHSGIETAVAISSIILLAYGSQSAQSWVERRTGRTRHPSSESYDATFYGIGLGISLAALFIFGELHPVAFVAIAAGAFTLATVIAIAMFGSQAADNEES